MSILIVWLGLLDSLASTLSAIAPLLPHPYDRLAIAAAQVCRFLVELLE
jgi:hypothetical protein